jgi:hypothetical protein
MPKIRQKPHVLYVLKITKVVMGSFQKAEQINKRIFDLGVSLT